jgi:hypothetical protein
MFLRVNSKCAHHVRPPLRQFGVGLWTQAHQLNLQEHRPSKLGAPGLSPATRATFSGPLRTPWRRGVVD